MKTKLGRLGTTQNKVPLLLALGTHGVIYSKKIGVVGDTDRELSPDMMYAQGDKKFFSGAIVPFLEEHVGAGKKVTVIEEKAAFLTLVQTTLAGRFDYLKPLIHMVLHPDLYGEDHFRNLFESVKSLGRDLDDDLERTINSGVFPPNFIDQMGFLEAVSRLNVLRPGSIKVLIEHQDDEAIWAAAQFWELMYRDLHRLTLTPAEMLEFMLTIPTHLIRDNRAYVRAMTEFAYIRDLEVAKQATEIVNRGEADAIVIPRGAAHLGLKDLLDPSVFDIIVAPDEKAIMERLEETPYHLAILERYQTGPLSEERIEHYSKLLPSI